MGGGGRAGGPPGADGALAGHAALTSRTGFLRASRGPGMDSGAGESPCRGGEVRGPQDSSCRGSSPFTAGRLGEERHRAAVL